MPLRSQKSWLKVLVVFAFWTVLGVAFGVQFHFASEQIGNPVPWSRALTHSLCDWYVFALLSVPAVLLSRHFAIERPHWGRALLVHFFASIVFALSYVALRSSLALWQSADSRTIFAEAFTSLLVKSWHFDLIVYWVIVAVSHAFSYYEQLRERELRNAELERRLTEARLQALQMQLNPHFLFNTLHAISSLMHKDVDAADAMLVRLSELLRHALEATNTQEVTLREELDFLRRYLEIEQTRFGKRLKIEMNIAPETLDAFVPNLILQPSLENAIIHGIEPQARDGEIQLLARKEGESLHIEVRDNGAGIGNKQIEDGVGLSNTRARLQQLYGASQQFTIANGPGGGAVMTMILPFRRAAVMTSVSPLHAISA
ncbi:MAG TPA: sensor histidine kinase, partial [Candidatus Acidoferrum sp.]|nr:sensor histidine kinase [Candidatus Acidoferrum sp.]